MFTLFSLENQSFLAPRAIFADGRAASRAARLLSTKTGRKYQPRPLPQENAIDWRAREWERFESGEYIHCCDAIRAIAPEDHFAHIAKKRPELVAYTKDATKGAQDIQSLLSIKAYVELIAPDFYSESAKEQVINEQKAHAIAVAAPVKFAGPCESEENADLIEEIYTNYDGSIRALDASCMRHDASDFQSDGIHPVRAYASPDVAIAYMQNENGETIARALVWPEKKLYSRAYAGSGFLIESLKKMGYSGDKYYGYDNQSFAGARLKKIYLGDGRFVMPYIDGMSAAREHGRYLVLDDCGELSTRETNGTTGDESIYCEHCDEHRQPDDMRTVYTNARRSNSYQMCSSCVSHADDVFYCEGYDDYFERETVDEVEANGRTYSLAYAENHLNYCEHDDEWTRESLAPVFIDEHGGQGYWSSSARRRDAILYQGDYYSTDHIDVIEVTTAREYYVHRRRAICFICSMVETIPAYIARDIAYEAIDGEYYLNNAPNSTLSPFPPRAINPKNYHGA